MITDNMPQPPEGVPKDAMGFADGTFLHGEAVDYLPQGEWLRYDRGGRVRERLTMRDGLVVAREAVELKRPATVPASMNRLHRTYPG